jgi:glycosyltransferase involved in cell wall biosynthesis
LSSSPSTLAPGQIASVTSHSSPQVSVLIPTYKYARYLPQAIDSVLNQSFEDFELLISDDDSKDGSAEIIQAYAAKDRRIRFALQSPNLGMVRNWNWCLEQARGAYVKFLFGDDFLMRPDAIRKLFEMMETRPDITLAASARTVVDENSRPIELWNNIQHTGVFNGMNVISWSLRANCNLVGEPSVVMFRKSDAGRGFDLSYKQVVDWEFWIHLLERGNPCNSRP